MGSEGLPANFEIISNEFKLKVYEGIDSGNAHIEFNDKQDKALIFNSTDNKEYIILDSTDNDEAVILSQKFVLDQGIMAKLSSIQGQVNTSSASKSYFQDGLGSVIQIPFNVDNVSAVFSGLIKGHNSSGTVGDKVLSATFRVALNRIGGIINVKGISMSYISDEAIGTGSNLTTFVAGVESTDNNNLKIFIQANTTTSINWKVGKLEYFIS